jgi:hypothetical protein
VRVACLVRAGDWSLWGQTLFAMVKIFGG